MGFFSGILSDITDPVATLASGLIGGAASAYGASQANSANLQIAQQNNQLSEQEAQEQMAFQERMSNTAYQRATADMEAAGLNPMLAYQQGGASTPGGAQGTVFQPPAMQNVEAAGIQGASAAAQTSESNARTNLVYNQAAMEDLKVKEEQWTYTNFGAFMSNKLAMSNKEVDQITAAIANLAKEGQLLDAKTAATNVEKKLNELGVPQAKAIAGYWSSEWGKAAPYGDDVRKWISSAGQVVNAAKGTSELPAIYQKAK